MENLTDIAKKLTLDLSQMFHTPLIWIRTHLLDQYLSNLVGTE